MPLHRLEKRSLSKLTASPLDKIRNFPFGVPNPGPVGSLVTIETLGQAKSLGQGHKIGLRAVTCLAVTIQIKTLILFIIGDSTSTC